VLTKIDTFQNGIATNADPGDLGTEYSLVTQNFLLDQPGRLVKRPGRSAAVTINSTNFDNLIYWSPSNLKIDGTAVDSKWIGYDATANKLKFLPSNITGGVTSTDLGTSYSSNIPDEFELQDHGMEFRFAPDNINHKPKILQHISRKFFGDAYDVESQSTGYRVDEYVFQDAYPISPTDTQLAPGTIGVLASAAGMSVTNNKTYNYKFSPVYDGIQELPLGESYITKSVTDANSALKVPFIIYAGYLSNPTGTAPNKTYPINPRMTSVKVYRESENSGTYFHIGSVPISRSSETAIADEPVSKSAVLNSKKAIYSDYFVSNYSSLISSTGVFSSPNVTIDTDNVTAVRWYYALRTNTSASRGSDDKSYDKGQVLWISAGAVTGSNGTTYSATFDNGPLDSNQFKADLQKGFINVDERNGASGPGVSLNETSQTSTAPHYIFNDGSTSIITKWLYYETTSNSGTFHALTPAQAGVGSHTEHQNVLNICWHNRGLVFPNIANDRRWSKNQANGFVVYNGDITTVIEESIGKAVKVVNNAQFGNLVHPYVNVPIINFIEGASGTPVDAKTKVVLKSGIAHGLSTGDSIAITGCIRGDFNGTFTVTVYNAELYINYDYDTVVLDQDLFGTNTVFNIASSTAKVSRYLQKSFSTTTQFVFMDTGLTNGSQQPFIDELKTKVNYKYSQMMGNRLFVGNVKLDPEGLDENHPDWIIYSEWGMPDVLPAVNYIQIKDQQGGEIVSMNKILDSLVVFMTRGVYRLDVGSGDNPTNWSLLESDENRGLVSTKGVARVKDSLYFCSSSGIYKITPDFRFTEISEPINDVYQNTSNLDKSRLFYDVKRDRILCRFGNETQTIYVFNVKNSSWSTLKFSATPSLFYSSNDALDTFGFRHTSPEIGASALMIHELHSSSPSESMDIEYKTGFMPLTDINRKSIIRRMNLNYESSTALTCKLYADGDETTLLDTLTFPANNVSKDYLVSIKPGGIRAKTLQVKINANSNTNVKINKLEIESDE